MPISAELRRALYNTREWKDARERVRARAQGRCECRGQCGKRHPGADDVDVLDHVAAFGQMRDAARAELHLIESGRGRCESMPVGREATVAHVDHNSGESVPDEKLAFFCAACHLRYDEEQHLQARREHEREELEARGQLSMFDNAYVLCEGATRELT